MCFYQNNFPVFQTIICNNLKSSCLGACLNTLAVAPALPRCEFYVVKNLPNDTFFFFSIWSPYDKGL